MFIYTGGGFIGVKTIEYNNVDKVNVSFIGEKTPGLSKLNQRMLLANDKAPAILAGSRTFRTSPKVQGFSHQ